MPINSRNKGAAGEREFAAEIKQRTAIEPTRNLVQTRNGGHDLLGIEGWAPEVKRQEVLQLDKWWKQACDQAAAVGAKPLLAYRQNRKPWHVVVRLSDISDRFSGKDDTCTISIDSFCELL